MVDDLHLEEVVRTIGFAILPGVTRHFHHQVLIQYVCLKLFCKFYNLEVAFASFNGLSELSPYGFDNIH